MPPGTLPVDYGVCRVKKLNGRETSAGQRVAAVDEMGMGACPCACDSPVT